MVTRLVLQVISNEIVVFTKAKNLTLSLQKIYLMIRNSSAHHIYVVEDNVRKIV